MYQRPIFVRG